MECKILFELFFQIELARTFLVCSFAEFIKHANKFRICGKVVKRATLLSAVSMDSTFKTMFYTFSCSTKIKLVLKDFNAKEAQDQRWFKLPFDLTKELSNKAEEFRIK